MAYEVQTPIFEGPFDLLLHLILKQQVELYDINLSEIVDAYLQQIETMEQLDLEIATEFLLIAATLVELKTRRLLPEDTEIDLDDEFSLWEERDLLLARLVECKVFKDAALVLRQLSAEAARSYPRSVGPVEDHFIGLAPDMLRNTTLEDLRDAYGRATAPKPVVRVDLSHVSPIKITVAKVVGDLVEELPRHGRMTFRQLTSELVDRIEIVVYFLAVLELFKRGFVELEQPETFGDIAVVWTGGAAEFVGVIGVDDYEG
ncbi:MAG: segregation/condensation protein A [Acidimicrobiaceae bacterium]|nr:segregation/condensation protein A [Acidimicrobiaceae bacterium]MXW62616.1 segregation/condensation protein A [Acidimicrobiaceae bacterium]MXW74746.1 segregation/condensation protein A [Acidimicrobiaceae bacterium]MYA73469.1 segregation/condensation protein A [Acidimicrobiaceae bacterium]MYC42061.1 segregation/condensation protein A [Acidimicrobiaceae bacterium]